MLATVACGARLSNEQYVEARGAREPAAEPAPRRAGPAPPQRPAAPPPAAARRRRRSRGRWRGGDGGAGGAAGPAAGQRARRSPPTRRGHRHGDHARQRLDDQRADPGFGATGRAGVKAYVDFINTQGGVCGRKLSLVNGDDRLDPGTNRSETEQLKDQVFGFVGGITVVDDGGADVIDGTNIPDCSLIIGTPR